MPGRTKEETAVVSSTERAVLGLLTSGEQSGYDLLKEAERSVGFFWTPAKTLLRSCGFTAAPIGTSRLARASRSSSS